MNINQIAKMAGVSRATVSRYLNEGYVSNEKRERIKQVIEETGYNPSSQAQTLRTKKTKLIGVILPKLHSDSVSRMVDGIGLVLSKHGYQLLLANTQNDEREELKYLTTFKYNQVDGIILIGTIFTDEHKKLLSELKVPIVILGQHLEGYPCVYHDDFHATKDLAAMLLENASRIAYIGVTQKDEAAGHNRQEGFLAAYASKADRVEKPIMLESNFTIECAYEKAKELFAMEDRIDTVCCATDNIAVGVLKYVTEIGKKVPEDVQIAGIGDSQLGRVVWPKLSTVHYHYKTSGIEAAYLLLELLECNSQRPKQIRMGYQVIANDSTRK